MDEFTTEDHDRLARIETMMNEIRVSQALTLRHQRMIPRRVAFAVAAQVTRRAALLIALGMFLGSALGTASGDILRAALLKVFGGGQ